MKSKRTRIAVAAIWMLALSATAGFAQLPDPGMTIDVANTALVVTDPQNDFLSPDGDGYAAALTNFRFMANAVRTTEQVATEMVGAETAGRLIAESRRAGR